MLLPAPCWTSWHIPGQGGWQGRAEGRRNGWYRRVTCKHVFTMLNSINNLVPRCLLSSGPVIWALALEHNPTLKYFSSQLCVILGILSLTNHAQDRACRTEMPSCAAEYAAMLSHIKTTPRFSKSFLWFSKKLATLFQTINSWQDFLSPSFPKTQFSAMSQAAKPWPECSAA